LKNLSFNNLPWKREHECFELLVKFFVRGGEKIESYAVDGVVKEIRHRPCDVHFHHRVGGSESMSVRSIRGRGLDRTQKKPCYIVRRHNFTLIIKAQLLSWNTTHVTYKVFKKLRLNMDYWDRNTESYKANTTELTFAKYIVTVNATDCIFIFFLLMETPIPTDGRSQYASFK